MALTYVKIASATVGAGGASDITISNIPATYNDLIVKLSTKTNFSGDYDYIAVRFNGASTSLTSAFFYAVPPSTIVSTAPTSILIASNANNLTSVFSNAEVYVPNYVGSTNKSVSADGVSEGNVTSNTLTLTAGLWSNTAAITSISFHPLNGTGFLQHSTAVLYGISRT